MWILGATSYQQVRGGLTRWGGIKVEFGGFIGGFGKIFFTKGGIKREKRVLRRMVVWTLGRVEERQFGWSFGKERKGK